MMSRRRGVEDSYVAKNTPSDARTTTSDRSAVWSAFATCMPPGLQALRRLIAPLGLFGLLRDDRDYAERAGF